MCRVFFFFFFAIFFFSYFLYLFSICQRIFVPFYCPVATIYANFAYRSIVTKWTSSAPYATAWPHLHWLQRIRIPNTLEIYAITMSSTIMWWAWQAACTTIIASRWIPLIIHYTAQQGVTLWWTSSAASAATALQCASASNAMPTTASAALRLCIIIVASSRRTSISAWTRRSDPPIIFAWARTSSACPSACSALHTIYQRPFIVTCASAPTACCASPDIIPITNPAQWAKWLAPHPWLRGDTVECPITLLQRENYEGIKIVILISQILRFVLDWGKLF